MLVLVVLCAVAALVLLMVLLQTRGALASTDEALTRSKKDLTTVSERARNLDAHIVRLEAEQKIAEQLAHG